MPVSNVVSIESELPWEELAAIPESYATAWTCLHRNLALTVGQTLVNTGSDLRARAGGPEHRSACRGTRDSDNPQPRTRIAKLEALGAQRVELEGPDLSERIRELHLKGCDAVLDLVGNSVILDSLAAVRRGRKRLPRWIPGRAWLPSRSFNPLLQMPSGVQFSFFGSFRVRLAEFPLSDVPLQDIIDRVASGNYKANRLACFVSKKSKKLIA